MKSYLKKIGIALSVLFNIILGGASNQSFSARNYDWKRSGKLNLTFIIDFVALKVFNDENHCLSAWAYWYTRKSTYEEDPAQHAKDIAKIHEIHRHEGIHDDRNIWK
jgi:hypothetical protein